MGDIKARPILFSAPMVRALLDGRKTQTRGLRRAAGMPSATSTRSLSLPSVDLRDYFAAAALTGILSCREQYLAVLADRKEAFPEEAIALECGRLADAMLKAREGKS